MRAGLYSPIDVLVCFKAGEDDDTGVDFGAFERMQRVNSIHAGHAQVEKHHVGGLGAEHFQRVFAAGCRAGHLHACLRAKHAGEAGEHHRVIIHDKNANRRASKVGHRSIAP